MRAQIALVLIALTAACGFAVAGVAVVTPGDIAGFTVDAPIEPLAAVRKDGRDVLQMRLPCRGKGVAAIRYTFSELQDWSDYETLEFDLFAQTTGENSHIQVQLFDAANNQVMMRQDLPPSWLGRWREIRWSFRAAKPDKAPLDFSRIKMIFFSAWQDHYGHQEGHVVDYLIGAVARQRAWEPTTLAVAPTPVAPVIDGTLDEACWKTTPVVEQFYGRKGMSLPKETSELGLLWDAEQLYVGIRCFAEVLDPVQQRQSDFLANVTEHGSRVFRDDCVELFLAAADDPAGYMQFASNALGARYEGKGTDGEWEAPWQAAGSTSEEGFWTLEIAIPWSSLGIEPLPGMTLLGNVYRSNKAQAEDSMWSPVLHGYHAPDEFGRFVLLGEAPAFSIRGGTIPPLMMGSNMIAPTLTGLPPGAGATVRLRHTQGDQWGIHTIVSRLEPGEAQAVEVPLSIETPGEVSVVYSILDAGTDTLYLRSPVSTFATAAVEVLTVAFDGPCEVFLNGKHLGRGGGVPLSGHLEPGPNALCVEADAPVAVTLEAGHLAAIGSGGWRQSAVGSEGWLEPGFDDSEWAAAGAAAVEKLDPAGGRFFRRTIAAEVTRVVRLGDVGDIHIVTGGAQHVPVVVVSPLERALADAKFVIELPPGLELVPWDDKKPYAWTGEYSGFAATSVERDGARWNRYELAWSLLQPLSYRGDAYAGYDLDRIHTLGFVICATGTDLGQGVARCWVEGEGGAVTEIPKELDLTVLPPLSGKRPEQIELLMCHGFGGGNYSEADMAALLDTMAAAGFNSYIERTHARETYYPLLRDRGFKIVAESTHYGWHRGMDLEGRRFVDFDEKHRGSVYTFACPLWTIEQGREKVMSALAGYIDSGPLPPEGLWWDMEYGPRTACFCEHCLKRFAEDNNLADPLTKEAVIENHLEQWIEFTCRMWAGLSAVYQEGFKRAVPTGQMYTYSGYQTPRSRETYCIDWSLMRDGCDVASAGYGWTPTIIGDTVAALDGVPLLGGVLCDEPPRNANIKIEYLRLLAAGCKGVMHFTWQGLDGLDYTRIAEAAALVAENETFFTDGVQADDMVEVTPRGGAVALRHGDRLLVIVTNSSSAEQQYTLSIPAATGAAAEYYTGVEYPDAKRCDITVPAHDARALLVPAAL